MPYVQLLHFAAANALDGTDEKHINQMSFAHGSACVIRADQMVNFCYSHPRRPHGAEHGAIHEY